MVIIALIPMCTKVFVSSVHDQSLSCAVIAILSRKCHLFWDWKCKYVIKPVYIWIDTLHSGYRVTNHSWLGSAYILKSCIQLNFLSGTLSIIYSRAFYNYSNLESKRLSWMFSVTTKWYQKFYSDNKPLLVQEDDIPEPSLWDKPCFNWIGQPDWGVYRISYLLFIIFRAKDNPLSSLSNHPFLLI